MMLRRFHKQAVQAKEGTLERKTSKRQRLLHFFKTRTRKAQVQEERQAPKADAVTITSPQSIPEAPVPHPNASVAAEPNPTENESTVDDRQASAPAPPSESTDKETVEILSEAQLHLLFSGAPVFSIQSQGTRLSPTVTYPYSSGHASRGLSDSLPLDEPAFCAATLHKIPAPKSQAPSTNKGYNGYDVDIVESPDMLSAQGIEPGSIGFAYFLELPKSDSLVTELEESQSSKNFLQGTRNKELMQSSPERIGIRAVDMNLVHDRLVEFQDLYETFHDSPEPMTILNNQSSGELYANLFSKFLMPPGHDGSENDPTGLQIQIFTLSRILGLKGIWYDFSLVEWRIRLGQLIWSDPEPVPEHEPHPLWTEREILVLQITLACELLLRLDAVSIANAQQAKEQLDIRPEDIGEFFDKKSRKVDWDLVLARRFLDNVLTVKNGEMDVQTSGIKSGGLLSILGVEKAPAAPKSDLIFLPQHQTRQISGLAKFAERIQWPNPEVLLKDLLQKLGVQDNGSRSEQLPSPSGLTFEPVTPSAISVYGTPLQTPRSGNHLLDGYFGHIGKPVLSRNNSRSLRIPLSRNLSSFPTPPSSTDINVGGWLSRSYLTGFVLPGEAVSHFLISTLLENDASAIAKLGDSANLYGGFSYAGRTWWSKNSIVGRVFACLEGSAECMGWISFSKLPTGLAEGWHSIHSDQLPIDDRLKNITREDVVARGTAIIPDNVTGPLKPDDLVLPSDSDLLPASNLLFAQWDLSPLNPDLMDSDVLSGPPTESDIYVPSVNFTAKDGFPTQTLTLAFDVQFITSWPCISPNASPAPSLPLALKRSLTGTVSRASSKRSTSIRMSRRNSHGFEPLLSHPPDSTDIAPKPMPPIEAEDEPDVTDKPAQLMHVHPLHSSYSYKIVPATHAIASDFRIPFDVHSSQVTTRSNAQGEKEDDSVRGDKNTILILDARGSTDLHLLARSWCAEKGYHAIIGRVSRTCLACCIREARGLGINIVIRV